MGYDVFEVGNRVTVTSYSPFKGLRGTIRAVDIIATELEDEEIFCFYQIVLEGAYIREPIWFKYDEVELVGPSKGSKLTSAERSERPVEDPPVVRKTILPELGITSFETETRRKFAEEISR
jgi:hypothetical protein